MIYLYAVSREHRFVMASGINRMFVRGPWHRKLPFAVIFRCLRALTSTTALTRQPAKPPCNYYSNMIVWIPSGCLTAQHCGLGNGSVDFLLIPRRAGFYLGTFRPVFGLELNLMKI